MSIAADIDTDRLGLPCGPADAPAVSEMPEEWAADQDAFEDALFEARACGDPGYLDRMSYGWWAELDDVPTPDDPQAVRPSDVLDRYGRAQYLQVAARAKNQADAAFLAAVHQTGHAQGLHDSHGFPCRDRSALPEIGMALRHSTSMAGYQLGLAEAVIDRLPKLYEAMAAGWLDLAKAKAFVDGTAGMPDDLARMVVGHLVPRASGWAKDELSAQISIAAGQLDPDWFERREQAAHARARVEYRHNVTGTGDVALRDVGAAARARIQARGHELATELRAAARRLGLPLGLPALRALATQRLLDGSYSGYDETALLRALTDELPAWYAELTGSTDDGGGDGRPDEEGGEDGPTDGEPDDAACAPTSHEAGADAEVRLGTEELRLRLSTVLGLDELPATMAGSGPLSAPSARRMLADVRDGEGAVATEYRLVTTSDDGFLEHVLLVRPGRPPRRPSPRGRERPRGRARGTVIVELAAPTTMLAALDPDAHPDWADYLRRAHHQLATLEERGQQLGGPNHPATTLAEAHKRLPGAALARFVRVRDRNCPGPMCRRTAHSGEIDHTRDWAWYGLTVAGNLSPPCSHCHALKHQDSWTVTQPEPGRFEWTSPLGAAYTVEPRPVLDTPLQPAPRPDGRPRPVRDIPRPPRATSTGEKDESPRRATFHEIPTRPPEPTDRSDLHDEPPPF